MADPSPPSTFPDLQDLIAERHHRLSKRLQQVSHYVMDHTESVAFDTLAEIAREAGVHASTLVRFANALGYSGFSEMQRLFKSQFLEEQPSYSKRIRLLQHDDTDAVNAAPTPMQIFTEFTRANLLSLERLHREMAEQSLDEAIDLLEAARSIFVVGVRRSFPAAAYFTYALRHIDLPTHLVDGSGGMLREQIGVIGPEDVLVGISFKPYGEETLTTLRVARERGAKTLLITDSRLSPAFREADASLIVKEAEVRAFRSLSATLVLAQSLCIGLAYRLERHSKAGQNEIYSGQRQ